MRRGVAVVSILNFGLSGCFTAKRKFVPPTPAPVVAKPLPEPQFDTPPEMEAAVPKIEIEPVTLPMPPQMEPPVAKPVQAKKPAAPVPAPVPAGPPTPEAEPPAPAPTPQLGEMLTADRRRQYENLFAERVSGAQSALNRASGHRLNRRQQETVQRIRTFLQQAEETKAKDLVTALEFARRAELFGRDLAKSLQ